MPVDEEYGDLPRHRGQWWVPAGDPVATVVLVHGGYWKPMYDLHLEDAVASDLAARGYLVWNIDYRAADAGWPATLTDVAAAYDHLPRSRFAGRVDPDRIAVAGHSAGGHLALWLASRRGSFAPAADIPRPRLAVGQAPVAALAAGVPLRLGGGAIPALLGGTPEQVAERYAEADPMALLPSGTRTVVIHSAADDAVPISQSETYVAAATSAGDDCTLVRVGGDHYAHLDPSSEACQQLRAALATLR